jgi:hypothetical protein
LEIALDDIDPSQRLKLDVLEEEYRRRHGVGVEWIKAEVGDGEVFENGVGRVVLSENGGWFECIDLPMEFSGVVGEPCERRFASDSELVTLTERLVELTQSPESGTLQELGLLILYDRAGVVDERAAFIYQRRAGEHGEPMPPIRGGKLQPGRIPAVVRCRVYAREDLEGLTLNRGVIVCNRGVG